MADELIAMFGRITTNDHDALVEQFSRVLQVDRTVSVFFLEASQWNVETAVHNYLASMQQLGHSGGHADDARGPLQPLAHPPQAVFAGDLAPWQSRLFQPGTRLPIRLRFHNTGQEAWPRDARLVFVDGNRMGGPAEIAVRARAGEAVEAIVVLTAPDEEGSHMGSWRLACSHGYFGDPLYLIVGAHAGAPPAMFPEQDLQLNGRAWTVREDDGEPMVDDLVGAFSSKLVSEQQSQQQQQQQQQQHIQQQHILQQHQQQQMMQQQLFQPVAQQHPHQPPRQEGDDSMHDADL